MTWAVKTGRGLVSGEAARVVIWCIVGGVHFMRSRQDTWRCRKKRPANGRWGVSDATCSASKGRRA